MPLVGCPVALGIDFVPGVLSPVLLVLGKSYQLTLNHVSLAPTSLTLIEPYKSTYNPA